MGSVAVDLNEIYAEDPECFLPTHYFIPKIGDYGKFIDSIYNYIIESMEIEPRTFELADNLKYETHSILDDARGLCALRYSRDTSTVEQCQCMCSEKITRAVHVHPDELTFCTEPEVAAVLYVSRTVFGTEKQQLLVSVKSWLPEVTVDFTTVCLVPKRNIVCNSDRITVCGDLHSTYALLFLYAPDRVTFCDFDGGLIHDRRSVCAKRLVYVHATSDSDLEFDRYCEKHSIAGKPLCNIVTETFVNRLKTFAAYHRCYRIVCDQYEIMVRMARSRSRSCSPLRRRRRSCSPRRKTATCSPRRRRRCSPMTRRRRRSPGVITRSRSRSASPRHRRRRSRSKSHS